MVKAYIVLAHNKPKQLFRLIKALDDENSRFFIHIDSAVDLVEFKNLDSFGNKVHFLRQVSSKWASYGLVQCTLNAMKTIKESEKKFDRIILLSGQDYPIKSNSYINQFLKESSHSVFLEYCSIPNYDRWPETKGGLYRVDKYFFGLRKHQLFFSKSMNFIGNIFPFLRRKPVLNMKPFAGSQWWIMDMYALNYILDFVERHPEYTAYHKHTFASDEVFFQMILLNSLDEKIKKSIMNDNGRFMKWQTPMVGHPAVLVRHDFEEIVKSKSLFARKFDDQTDYEILNLIDYIRA